MAYVDSATGSATGTNPFTASAAGINDLAGGVSDFFAAYGEEQQAAATGEEAATYGEAATLAQQNEQFTKESTAITEAQQNRQITQAAGRTTAQVAGAGFANSGSGLDLMRSNAQQGSLAQAVMSQQGLMTEAGYAEQSQADLNLQQGALDTEAAEKNAATGSIIGGVLKGAAGIASLAALVH